MNVFIYILYFIQMLFVFMFLCTVHECFIQMNVIYINIFIYIFMNIFIHSHVLFILTFIYINVLC